MINRYTLALLAAIFSAVFFCESSMAKEDTAQITLKKTAISKQNLYTYTVKKRRYDFYHYQANSKYQKRRYTG